jgi:endonuclease YncB( thermonuclease family)
MARKKKSTLMLVVTMLVAALLWWIDNREEVEVGVERAQGMGEAVGRGGYDGFEACRLVKHGGNDGDSFHVSVPGQGREEYRLYFVDAPESAYKEYRDGEDNGERLRFQGQYFGGLSRQETTGLGQVAKAWTTDLLGAGKFAVYTRGELVYGGPRMYAFVEVEYEGRKRWLHELLVEQGLARIYTKGATLPDGTSEGKEEGRLKGVERGAKKRRVGGWR